MDTIYNTSISNILTSDYLDYLTDKVFALLPMYEDAKADVALEQSFKTYQNTLIQTINGNINLIQYNDKIVVDILSHLESLKTTLNHQEHKRHILKICKLLSILKKGVMQDGI
jgi:hypothetical protein